VEFENLADARDWTRQYTRWLHDEAPGLEVVVAHRPYDGRPLAWALKALAIDLARAKLERRPTTPQLGLGVTAACSVTGLPATAVDQGEFVSARIAALRKHSQQARTRWKRFLPESLNHAPGWTADFPDELDRMGRTRGETSLIGVVHIDGNGVGRAIQQWLDRCLEDELDDGKVRTQCHEWSDKIVQLGEHVLKAVVNRVASCIVEEEDEKQTKACLVRGTPYELGFTLRVDTTARQVLLPIRPILLGGDDLTLVCDGRIALDLAVIALQGFAAQPIPHLVRAAHPEH
jgi:hypothetical protein